MSSVARGSQILCSTLERLGVEHVFGVPGGRNVELFDALNDSRGIRVMLAAHEGGAAFMANGYYRACGKPAVLLTIPGPGFTYALTGLAEAQLDSSALLHIVGQPAQSPGTKFQLQAIDQASIARPLVKGVFDLDQAADIPAVIAAAYEEALRGEPGPVVVHVARGVTSASAEVAKVVAPHIEPSETIDASRLAEVGALLDAAHRPILFLGQGAAGAAEDVRQLAERHRAAVFTTTSARGALPEDHELNLCFDFLRGGGDELNDLVASCDLILALGCKFSHNSTGGFELKLPEDRLVHVNSDGEALHGDYPAHVTLQAPVETVARRLLDTTHRGATDRGGWDVDELAQYRQRFARARRTPLPEPNVHGLSPGTPAKLFSTLRDVMPRDSILVADAGLHQVLARRHFEVLAPRGFLVPTNFQSMGFGIPAAIGAKLAAPERPVVALVGDGGFIMSGMEVLTAVRERVPLTIVVFNDGRLSLVHRQQIASYGRSSAVALQNPDFERFADAVGAGYASLDRDGPGALAEAIQSPSVTIVEVRLGDNVAMHLHRASGATRRHGRQLLGPALLARLKRVLRRG